MNGVIVTGATGFVGRWLIDALLKESYAVIAIVRPGSKNLHFLTQHSRLQIVECSMKQYHLLPEKLGARNGNVFYHLAWDGVSGAMRMNPEVQMGNIQAAAEALKVAAKIGCSRFVGLGSIMEAEAIAVTDADGSSPGAGYIYGEAKHFAHLQTKIMSTQYGLQHMWAILTNVYGEYEFSTRFISTTLKKIIRHEPLEFTAGTQLYDFLHVEDAVRALIAIGERGKAKHNYLIGSGHARPLRKFVEIIGRELAPEQRLHFGSVPYTGVQLPMKAFSIQKLIDDTGFVPQISFEKGIRRTMEWIKTEGI